MPQSEKKILKTDKMPKGKAVILTAAVIGIFLIAAGGLWTGKTENSTPAYTDVGFYTEYLEARIASLCRHVNGIDEAEVFLTIDCSSEYIYEKSGGSDYLILSGEKGEEAVMLCEIYPKVRGIAVVCTGGDLPQIRETLTELLCAALDLPANKIRIAGSAYSSQE